MLPILLNLGFLKIYSYGFFAALGFLAGFYIIWKKSRDEELNEETIFDYIFTTIIFGLIGARFFYIFYHPEVFIQNPIRIVHLVNYPGLSFFGALILGTPASIFFLIRKKLTVFQILDITVLGLALGHTIARVGCFLNGCCFGIKTNLPWAVNFPGVIGKRHPTQLYEAILVFMIFLVLSRIYSKTKLLKKEKRGYVVLCYFIFYSLVRFGLEFLRDNSVYSGILVPGQLFGAIFLTLAILLFVFRYRREIKNWFVKLFIWANSQGNKLYSKIKKQKKIK